MFKTLLQTFAWELRQEAGAKDQRGAAYVFWCNAAYAAKCVYEYWSGVEGSEMSKLLTQLPERKIQLDHVLQQVASRTTFEDASDHDADISNEWEDQKPEEPVYLKRLEDFITSSSAFQNLRESLRDWARSSTSTKGTNIDYDILFTKTLMSTAQDFCKKAVERAAGTRLTWWPLAEPEKELRPNYTRIYSQPRIGSGRADRCFYDDIPTSLAENLFPSHTIMRGATLNWRWRCYSKAVSPTAVFLRGTTLMQQQPHSVSGDGSKRQKSTAAGALNGQSVHKDGSKAGPHITKRGDRTTAPSSKPQGKQSTTVNDGHGKESIPTVRKPATTRPRRDDGKEPEEDGGAHSPDMISKKGSPNECRPVLFLSVDIVTNDSRACSVDVGIKDLDTMENLRRSYNALRSSHFWNQRYPAKDDKNYEWKLEDEYGDIYPNGEAWYFFNHPEDCGTSTTLKEMLPKKFKDEEKSGTTVYGMYIEQRHSVWQIFIPAVLLLGLTLGSTLWFIPLWLKDHPGDLQNATVPALLAFTVIQFILALLTSLIIFQWSL
ncbi:hypothetical protein GQ44DRAFT_731073 [Phaeosphaeriaceae sp. PMI808]|nr:hypothetical protein GQ44DRAFT_731073 [Phaeosphaeriaceae sp. PMI808]